MTDDAVLRRLAQLMSAEKVATDTPDWIVDHRPQGNRVRLVCPLLIEGVVEEGLRIELSAPEAVSNVRPFKDLTALVMVNIGSKTMLLARIEFDPSPVEGPNHRNPVYARDVPPVITGAHIHPFDLNARRGLVDLAPEANLPIAIPIKTKFSTFEDILEIIRREFNIPGLWFGEPKWHQLLI